MKFLMKCFSLFVCLTLFACSSTSSMTSYETQGNSVLKTNKSMYMSKSLYTRNTYTPAASKTLKLNRSMYAMNSSAKMPVNKPNTLSDRELMIRFSRAAQTGDQAMMVKMAQTLKNYKKNDSYQSMYLDEVKIRGSKSEVLMPTDAATSVRNKTYSDTVAVNVRGMN